MAADVMAENQTKTYTFTRSQFVGLLLGAVITAFVTGVFSTIRTLNSDHFTLVSVDRRVVALEENFVPRNEVDLKFEAINNKIDNNTKLLERIANKLNIN